jgi:hypothetical protein
VDPKLLAGSGSGYEKNIPDPGSSGYEMNMKYNYSKKLLKFDSTCVLISYIYKGTFALRMGDRKYVKTSIHTKLSSPRITALIIWMTAAKSKLGSTPIWIRTEKQGNQSPKKCQHCARNLKIQISTETVVFTNVTFKTVHSDPGSSTVPVSNSSTNHKKYGQKT